MSVRSLLVAVVCLVALASSACAQTAGSPALPTSFEECVAQGGKVMKSFPARCVSESGIVFVDEKSTSQGRKACKDLCGDGTCQEMVCMALGCPCAETPQSCPQDCKG